MRLMRFVGTEPVEVSAAHSRVIAPGDVVDFHELVKPRDGAPYTLEFALMGYTGRFQPAGELDEVNEADTANAGSAAAIAVTAQTGAAPAAGLTTSKAPKQPKAPKSAE